MTTIVSNGLHPRDNAAVLALARREPLVKAAIGLYPVDAVMREILAAGVDYPREEEGEPPTAAEAIAFVREHVMDAFTQDYLPICKAEAVHRWLDKTCVFGERYGDLFLRAEGIVIVGSRKLSSASTLTELERQQILSAIEATAYDVSSTAEAFEAVDDQVIFETELWDASARRAFTAFEMGAGDNSFGKIFVHGKTTVAATINDGDLLGCTSTWGNERRRCTRNEDCRGDTACYGTSEESALGRCIQPSLDTHDAGGIDCKVTESDFGCPAGSGLVCAGAALDGEGLCLPGWMRGRFETRDPIAVPDNQPSGAEQPLLAYGLATVSMDIRLTLHVSHARIADLKVTLANPTGTETVVFEGKASDVAPELHLDGVAVSGIPGDESVNGVWRLKVVDRKKGTSGTLARFGLELTSRWD